MSRPARISLSVDSHTVARALEWLDRCAAADHWPGRTLFKLRLCLDETITNIVLYGFPKADPVDASSMNPAPELRLAIRPEADQRLILDIHDNGVAFDPTAQQPRALDTDLDDAIIGGHGLRLMHHYLEDIRYERRDGWNQLQLVAALDPA